MHLKCTWKQHDLIAVIVGKVVSGHKSVVFMNVVQWFHTEKSISKNCYIKENWSQNYNPVLKVNIMSHWRLAAIKTTESSMIGYVEMIKQAYRNYTLPLFIGKITYLFLFLYSLPTLPTIPPPTSQQWLLRRYCCANCWCHYRMTVKLKATPPLICRVKIKTEKKKGIQLTITSQYTRWWDRTSAFNTIDFRRKQN